jgi:geranylgeranyl pyrophosphate synthase
VTGTTEQLGKTAGKDQAQQKATYPALHGLDASRARATHLVGEALEALAPFGPPADPLRALAHFILERKA